MAIAASASPSRLSLPTPEERDERVKVDLPPDEFIAGVMETGTEPEDKDKEEAPKP